MFTLSERSKSFVPYEPLKGDFPLRLDANESFIEPSAKLKKALSSIANQLELNRYPDPEAKALRTVFAAANGVTPDMCAASNGSDEMISIVYSAFSDPGDRIAVWEPDFSMYRFYAALAGRSVVTLSKKIFRFDLPSAVKMLMNERPRILIFSNPCNPTGTGLLPENLENLVAAAEKVNCLVVADEAYMEFWGHSAISLIGRYGNLVILKTCSKALGSAALRVGFAVAQKELIRVIDAVRSPYNVSSFSQCAAAMIIADKSYTSRAARSIVMRRRELYRGMKEIAAPGVRLLSPCANFVTAVTDNAKDYFEAFLARGIAVRLFDGFLRITAGTPRENEAFLLAYREITEELRKG